MSKNEIVEKILSGLQKQKFADWYTSGRFDAYISADLTAPPEDEIKEDIAKLFNLN